MAVLMPSKRPQLNVRMDEEMVALLPDLLEAAREKMRLSGLSYSDLVRLGLLKLKDEMLPDWKPPKKLTAPKASR